MKKLFTMMAAALLAGWSLGTARAETVQNYTESFEGWDVSEHDFAPKGWGHIVDYVPTSNWYGDDSYVEYTNPATGGQVGAYLEAGSQYLGDYGDMRDVNDLLVTPAVTGNVSFYAKKVKESGTVTVYTCTRNEDGSFTMGTEYGDPIELTLDTWAQYTFASVPTGTYLGFRIEDAAIDEFAAASADVVLKAAMTVTKVSLVGENELMANEDNQITFSFDATVQNTGEVELTPGMEGYSLSIVNNSRDNAVVATKDMTETLAVGASTTVNISATITIELEEGEEEMYESFYVMENLGGTSQYGAWITGIPYVSIFNVYEEGYYSALEGGETFDFGVVREEPYTIHLQVANGGPKPLSITAIDLPEGFSHSATLPLTLTGEKQNIDVTLGTEEPGSKAGELVFHLDDGTIFTLNLNGLVLGGDSYYEDFEAEGLSAGIITLGDWELSKEPYDLQTDFSKQWMEKSTTNFGMLILPKLQMGEGGEALSFRAAKRTNDSEMRVYYSADRQQWISLDTITADEFTNTKPEGVYSGNDNYAFSTFSVNLPEGEWYVAFEAGYARLDDIYGGKLANVTHDLYLTGSSLPVNGRVNSRYTGTVSVMNVAQAAEAAESYTATLYVDGEAVAQADNTAEWAAGETKAFSFAYTPHAAGTFDAYVEITLAGDYKLATPESTITVAEETFSAGFTVGTANGTAEVPLYTFYKKSQSETVYPAAELQGLEVGTVINGLSYSGYNNSKELSLHVKVWVECTTDGVFEGEDFTPRDVAQMTLVYDSDYALPVAGAQGASTNLLDLPFTTPFEYTGGNLRVVMEHSCDTYGRVYFDVDTEVANTTIERHNDNDLANASWNKASGMPVVTLLIEAEAPTISGKVTDATTGEPIAGATVELRYEAEDVLYTGTTNEAGEYSIPILLQKSWINYAATVSKEGYVTYENDRAIVDFKQESIADVNFQLAKSGYTGLDAAEGEDAFRCYTLPQGLMVEMPQAATLHIYNVTGQLVRRMEAQAGQNLVEGLAPGVYVVNGQKAVVR